VDPKYGELNEPSLTIWHLKNGGVTKVFAKGNAHGPHPHPNPPLEGEGTSFDPFQTHASRLTPYALRLTLHASQKTFPPLQGLQGEG